VTPSRSSFGVMARTIREAIVVFDDPKTIEDAVHG
jgi:hypothetical protein